MSASTLGRVPDIPHLHDLIIVNRTTVTLILDAFADGGCHILYFVIEYRSAETQHRFQLVANNVSPAEKVFTIGGLEPATRYFVRVTAHNTAGSSIAEYPFSTLTVFGGTVPPVKGSTREKSTFSNDESSTTTVSKTSSTSNVLHAVKIVSILFLSSSILVAAFYAAVFARKWKKKRDLDESRPFRHHQEPPNTPQTSQSHFSTLQKRQKTTTSSILDEQSPMLPPNTFRATPIVSAAVAANCPVAAVTAAGSNMYLQQEDSADICPYATFHDGQEQQVTLKLHPIEVETAFALNNPMTVSSTSFHPQPQQAGQCRSEPLYATLLGRHRDFPSREELAGGDGKRLISLQVGDTKYDSDSDFDYRQRPPRPNFRGRRRAMQHQRRRNRSSSSTDDEGTSPAAVMTLPRVRSTEGLEAGRWKVNNASGGANLWRRTHDAHIM